MTVIAADGKHIAADGRMTFGHSEIARDDCQKIIVRQGAIYALAGVPALMEALIAWHLAGADPKEMPALRDQSAWNFLVIDAIGPRLYSSTSPYPTELKYPCTFGCGCDYAMGALLAGASAFQAVQITCQKDSLCGGNIQVVDIDSALAGEQIMEAAE